MYGQANHGPPFGQGPQPPRATYQQPPPGPPPPPNFHFQQRPQAPPQQLPPGVPPHMGQAGPRLYQHSLPASFPPVHTSPSVQGPPLRTQNASESYRHPTPTVSQTYPGGQQVQHSSHFGAPNLNHNSTIAPPSHGPPCPEMVRPPHPLGALPPPPRPQGQMPLTTVFYPLPPYPGGVEGVKQNPPPPPPPPPPPVTASGFSAPSAYACSDSHASPAAPPLPPCCPAPIVPSLSLATSSSHSTSRPSGTDSLNPLPLLESIEAKPVQGIEDLCTSTADSDMEMEDDITLSDKDQKMDNSTDGLLNAEETDGKEQSNAPQISPENIILRDISSEFLNPHQQSEDLTLRPTVRVHSQIMHEVDAVECPSGNNLGKTVSHPANSLSPFSTSLAAETTTSRNNSKFIKAGSPIRLLQEYASDDSSENDDELLHKDINPSHSKLLTSRAGASSLIKDTSSCLETDTRSKSQLSKSNMNCKAAGMASINTRIADRCPENNHGNKKAAKDATSHLDFRNKSILDDGGAHDISKMHKTLNENEEKQAKFVSDSLRVDEFGRLVREGASDSDSDRGYANRHERRAKRERSRSRSRSPLDRRRTRRSSRRRKDKRNRSRSRSPRNRRSRSRSPSYRRAGEIRSEKIRSNRGRAPECFDFMRGRCYRGASCRYMHHEVGKSDSSRRYGGKQKNAEVPSGTENRKTKKESRNISVKLPDYLHDKTRIQEIQDGRVDWKREDIIMNFRQAISSNHIGELIDSGIVNRPSPREVSGTEQEMKITLEKSAEPNLHIHEYRTVREKSQEPPSIDKFPSQSPNSTDILNSRGETSMVVHPLMKNSGVHQHESNTLVAEDQNADCLSRQIDGSSVSDALPNQTKINSPKNLSNSASVPNIILPTGSLPSASSSQILPSEAVTTQYPAAKDLSPTCYTVPNIPHESSQLPPPPPFPPPHSENAPHMPQLPIGYTSMAQVAPFTLQSSHATNPHTYQASVANQHPQFCAPPNSSWTLPLPPPRPPFELRFGAETAAPGFFLQFQQSHFPPRNDFGSQDPVRPPTKSHSSSQVTRFLHQSHPAIQEPHQPNLQLENSSSGNLRIQLLAPDISREDRSPHPTVQELKTSNSLGLESLHQQPVTSQELFVNRMRHGNLPSGQLSQSSSEIHPFSHMQVASGHLKYHLGDGKVGLPVKTGSMSEYLPDLQERNQSSLDPNFGLPQIVAHHNPYASTFEQPLGSKLSFASLSQGKGPLFANQYDIPLSLKHVTVDGQGGGIYGCRETNSSPSSARAEGKILTSAGGDQYDPLFDSIEPTSSARKKDHHVRKWEPASDSDQMEKRSGSHKLVDLDENSRHEVAAVASTTSLDNDDFGETADAEVGAVEDESLSDPVGVATAEEIETETKSTGKKKKKKQDSRSTKPFKMAIADFVKEVLKPSWRQGNMSKEAFKTIVKKTVDKVSGAMKGHNVPKSRAKIDQYIDSSQRKLTKLVMGYVDKYVNV